MTRTGRKSKITREFLESVQGNQCAICGKLPLNKRLAVDHDHETGLIRGLLCSPCNGMLDKFAENIGEIVEYLDPTRIDLLNGRMSNYRHQRLSSINKARYKEASE